jgi:polyisoprenoid-binding protein YceI
MSLTQFPPLAGEYVVDPMRSGLSFLTRQGFGTEIRGRFDEFRGRALVHPSRPSSSWVELDVEANSVTTGDPQRDLGLRSRDVLDAAGHPVISYRSVSFSMLLGSRFELLGSLTIRRATRLLPLAVEYAGVTRDHAGGLEFHASAEISRRAWGLRCSRRPRAEDVTFGDRVSIQLDVTFIRLASGGSWADGDLRRLPRLSRADPRQFGSVCGT